MYRSCGAGGVPCQHAAHVAAQKFRLGVPIRDMRLLDPNLLTSETGKVLVRDNAIVFSVEHVRLIITADSVIIPQTGFERSPLSNRFAAMLEESIIEASQEKQVCWCRVRILRARGGVCTYKRGISFWIHMPRRLHDSE